MSDAYVAFGATMGGTESMPARRLKLVTLLFDRVHFPLINPVGQGEVISDDEFEPVDDRTAAALGKIWVHNHKDLPAYSIYGPERTAANPAQGRSWDHAPEHLKTAAEKWQADFVASSATPADRWTNYEAYKAATYTLSDILYWRQHFRHAAYIGDTMGEAILTHAQTGEPRDWPNLQAVSPDLTRVSWADIVDLRRSPFLTEFRLKYDELTRAGQVANLLEVYGEALEELADQCRPDRPRAVAKAVLGNLPIPIVNPFGLLNSAVDFAKAAELKTQFGWVFFMREIRRRKS